MVKCSYCGKEEALPFKCKFCGEVFCSDHRLPESHECLGLKEYKKTRSKDIDKWIYEPYHAKYKEMQVIKQPKKTKYKNLTKKIAEEISQRKIIYLVLFIVILLTIWRALG